MQLRARMVVEGFMVGLHKSPYHGFSVEFAEHRPYMDGDPLRNLDWKVYAKTDRMYVKQYEEETNLKSYILLDMSNSMNYTSGSITKFQYASYLAAALSFLMIQQRDAVILGVEQGEQPVCHGWTPCDGARRRPRRWNRTGVVGAGSVVVGGRRDDEVIDDGGRGFGRDLVEDEVVDLASEGVEVGRAAGCEAAGALVLVESIDDDDGGAGARADEEPHGG